MEIGETLSQLDEFGNYHPISYYRRTLNSHEKNFTAIKKDILVVTYALKQFRT